MDSETMASKAVNIGRRLRISTSATAAAVAAVAVVFLMTGPPSVMIDYEIVRLDFPAGLDSGEPFLTVSPAGVVYASWLEKAENGNTRFLFSSLTVPTAVVGSDENQAEAIWSVPVLIAEGDNWFVNWADVPSIAVGTDDRIAAHWLERIGVGEYAYGIRFVRSSDGGKTWSPAAWLHDDLSGTEHGFASLSMDSDGSVDAVWLDGRAMEHGRGGMAVRGRRIDPEGNFGEEIVLDEKTCECCPTSLARLEDGTLLAAYRNRSDSEVRDIAVSRRVGGQWSEAEIVSTDGWQISACPVNGPAIDANGSAAGIAWFSAPDDQPIVRAAFSESGNIDFGEAFRINEGKPIGRVGFKMLDEERGIVTWIESGTASSATSSSGVATATDSATAKDSATAADSATARATDSATAATSLRPGTAGIKMRIVHRDGTLENARVVAATSASRASGYPRVSVAGDRIIFLWTETGDTRRVVSAVARPRTQNVPE